MNSRAFFVLAIMEQSVVLGTVLYLLVAWIASRWNNRDQRRSLSAITTHELDTEPTRPFLVWINSLPRLGETPTAPLRPLGEHGFSVHVRQ